MTQLAPFTKDDIDRLVGWIDTEEALLFWTGSTFAPPLTRAQVEAHLRRSRRAGRLLFKAVDGDGEAVGHVEIGLIDPRTPTARISRVLIAPAAQGRRLGEAMVRAAVALAFERFAAHRVELGVFDVNPRAIAVYERIGFWRDGVRRDSFRAPGGGWWSEVVMSILAPEWEALQAPGG